MALELTKWLACWWYAWRETKECWFFLKKNLTNITEASPAWTAQFLSAAKAIGSERLKAANDKHAAITSAPEFQAAIDVRQQYLQVVTARMLEAL